MVAYAHDFGLEGLPDLNGAVVACRDDEAWVLGETDLQHVLLVVVHTLGVRLVRLPEDHAAVCRPAEQVIPARREVHVPNGLAMPAVSGQAGLQPQAP